MYNARKGTDYSPETWDDATGAIIVCVLPPKARMKRVGVNIGVFIYSVHFNYDHTNRSQQQHSLPGTVE